MFLTEISKSQIPIRVLTGLKLASWVDIQGGYYIHTRIIDRPGRTVPEQGEVLSDRMSASHFTISPKEAAKLVKNQRKCDDEKSCFLLQLSFQSVYSENPIPNTCFKKLPRLVNGIPLGPGVMARDQINNIRWRYVEGGTKLHTFISVPMYEEDAEETKRSLKDSLMKQSQAVFGDITVKASVILSSCLNYDDDIIINDIAVTMDEGLHFRD